jgi:DNA-binding PadR family transcriptional regulator
MSPMTQRPFRLELALLGFLNHSPIHGYSLYQQLSARTGLGRVWRLKPSQLYALLEKLEAAGLVASHYQPQEPHPPRRIFSLTQAGRYAYETWRVAAVDRPNEMRQLFFAKLYFCLEDSPEEAQILINRQREVAFKWLADQEGPSQVSKQATHFDKALQQYRTVQVKMILDWLDDCQAKLQSRQRAS